MGFDFYANDAEIDLVFHTLDDDKSGAEGAFLELSRSLLRGLADRSLLWTVHRRH